MFNCYNINRNVCLFQNNERHVLLNNNTSKIAVNSITGQEVE